MVLRVRILLARGRWRSFSWLYA